MTSRLQARGEMTLDGRSESESEGSMSEDDAGELGSLKLRLCALIQI